MAQNNKSLREEVIEQMRTLMAAGFGFVAALAWNEAIQELFKTLLPHRSGLVAKFLYAIAVTAIVVIVTTRLSRFGKRSKQE